MRIALFGGRDTDDPRHISVTLPALLRQTPGIEVVDGLPPGQEADMAVSFGGDGTMLATVRALDGRPVPVLGINTGRLGYLTAIDASNPRCTPADIVQLITLGALRPVTRTMLHVTTLGDRNMASLPCSYALNEVAITRDAGTQTMTCHTDLNGRPLASYVGDGLIVSTPTGSTAYNLSVGGPLLQPTLGAVILSPIAPHSLAMRPLVLGFPSVIDIRATSRGGSVRIALDGQGVSAPSGTWLRIRRARRTATILTVEDHSFVRALRTKLHWGYDPR